MVSGNQLFNLELIEVEKTSIHTPLTFEEIHKKIKEYLTEEIDTD